MRRRSLSASDIAAAADRAMARSQGLPVPARVQGLDPDFLARLLVAAAALPDRRGNSELLLDVAVNVYGMTATRAEVVAGLECLGIRGATSNTVPSVPGYSPGIIVFTVTPLGLRAVEVLAREGAALARMPAEV